MVPTHPLSRPPALLLLALAVVLAGCGGDGGDTEAFCAAVDDLRTADPFAELPVASPQEMRAAFDELRAGAERIEDTSPRATEVQAERYRAAVDELVDQMRGAGFDLRELDRSSYRRATREYADTTVSLDNAADAACR